MCKNEGLALSYVLGGGIRYGHFENPWDAVVRSAHAPSISFLTEHLKDSGNTVLFRNPFLRTDFVHMLDRSQTYRVPRGVAERKTVCFQVTGGNGAYVLKNPDGSFFGRSGKTVVVHRYTRTWRGSVQGHPGPAGTKTWDYDMTHDDGSKTRFRISQDERCTFDVVDNDALPAGGGRKRP